MLNCDKDRKSLSAGSACLGHFELHLLHVHMRSLTLLFLQLQVLIVNVYDKYVNVGGGMVIVTACHAYPTAAHSGMAWSKLQYAVVHHCRNLCTHHCINVKLCPSGFLCLNRACSRVYSIHNDCMLHVLQASYQCTGKVVLRGQARLVKMHQKQAYPVSSTQRRSQTKALP